jgi:hypothetical protein
MRSSKNGGRDKRNKTKSTKKIIHVSSPIGKIVCPVHSIDMYSTKRLANSAIIILIMISIDLQPPRTKHFLRGVNIN